ncbi:MAG: hypothetical protein E6I93_00825 [Chloroflexi bacterium]|nr:MAG: hypothetical protein E6I93_00825 [Chloroflexota bacterium]
MDESITRGTTLFEPRFTAQLHLCGQNRILIAPPVNGEVPVSFSLTLSGGFDAAPSIGLHSPDSLFDYANAY